MKKIPAMKKKRRNVGRQKKKRGYRSSLGRGTDKALLVKRGGPARREERVINQHSWNRFCFKKRNPFARKRENALIRQPGQSSVFRFEKGEQPEVNPSCI